MQVITSKKLPLDNILISEGSLLCKEGFDSDESSSASLSLKCQFCGANSTPMWRRGPSGKKTLCNACGLRWSAQNKDEGAESKLEDQQSGAEEEEESTFSSTSISTTATTTTSSSSRAGLKLPPGNESNSCSSVDEDEGDEYDGSTASSPVNTTLDEEEMNVQLTSNKQFVKYNNNDDDEEEDDDEDDEDDEEEDEEEEDDDDNDNEYNDDDEDNMHYEEEEIASSLGVATKALPLPSSMAIVATPAVAEKRKKKITKEILHKVKAKPVKMMEEKPSTSSSSSSFTTVSHSRPHGRSTSASGKDEYYCKYCDTAWPHNHFRNAQQFGAHCSNCSRKRKVKGNV